MINVCQRRNYLCICNIQSLVKYYIEPPSIHNCASMKILYYDAKLLLADACETALVACSTSAQSTRVLLQPQLASIPFLLKPLRIDILTFFSNIEVTLLFSLNTC